MVVLWLTLTLFVAVGSSVLKNQVQGLERRLDAINANIQKDIESIHVSFVGTGLGNIVCIYDDKTMEYADLTDMDCW